jgi:hypothetical protein
MIQEIEQIIADLKANVAGIYVNMNEGKVGKEEKAYYNGALKVCNDMLEKLTPLTQIKNIGDSNPGKADWQALREKFFKEFTATWDYSPVMHTTYIEKPEIVFEWFKSQLEETITPDSKRSCPCLYLDEPCHPMCTCKNGLYSHGCLYCASYGSIGQRKEAAKRIAEKLAPDSNKGIGQDVEEVFKFWYKNVANPLYLGSNEMCIDFGRYILANKGTEPNLDV